MNGRDKLIQAVEDQKVQDIADQAAEEVELLVAIDKIISHIRTDGHLLDDTQIIKRAKDITGALIEREHIADGQNEDYGQDSLVGVPF